MGSNARAALDRLIPIVSGVIDSVIKNFDESVNAARQDNVPPLAGLRVYGQYHPTKKAVRLLTVVGPDLLLDELIKQYQDDRRFKGVFTRVNGTVAFQLQ